MKLVTSNEEKLREFQRFGIPNIEMEKGRDIAEVEADPVTVILYKAIEAGAGRMVEDTSLHIEGEDIGVNIRWLMDTVSRHHGKKAKWEVLLGVNDGTFVTVYQGIISGTISNKFSGKQVGFGFDASFVPDGTKETLYELEEKGCKDNYSARKKAVESFEHGTALRKVKIADMPKWQGGMQ